MIRGQGSGVRGQGARVTLFTSKRIVSLRSDGTEQYYHPSQLGSASVITNASGSSVETIEYYPFGAYTGPNQNPAANYTFTGQEDDDGVGFYDYKARLYDPVLGRFISADSIVPDPGDSQALNRYSYVVNNPLVYTDPSGHFFWFAAAVFAGAPFGAGISAATGQNIAVGALTGAVSGAAFFGTGELIAGLRASAAIAVATQAGAAAGGSGMMATAYSSAAYSMAYQSAVSPLKDLDVKPARGPEIHPDRNYNQWHYHIGPVKKIPLK